MSSLTIEDGYTKVKEIEEAEGLHPAASLVFRPALPIKRTEFNLLLSGGNAEKMVAWENDLLAKQVVTLNGSAITKKEAGKLIPSLRGKILDVVLGYTPSDEAEDAGN